MTDSTSPAHAFEAIVAQLKWRFRLVMVSAGVACILLCGVIAYVVKNAADTSQEIQNQRYAACVAQNQRHDNSLAYIVSLVDHSHTLTAGQKARTVHEYRILFRDLAPHTRCVRVVHPLGK
jgi:hypothetical protein